MKEDVCKVLMVEDDEVSWKTFTELIEYEFPKYQCTRANSIKMASEALGRGHFDIVVSEFFLSDGEAFVLLKNFRETPFIFLGSPGNEETVVRAFREGVYDYLIKDREYGFLRQLPGIIDKAIRNKKIKSRLIDLYRIKNYIDMANVMLFAIDGNYRVRMINKRGCEILGLDNDDIIGADWLGTFVHEKDREKFKLLFDSVVEGKENGQDYIEYAILRADGTVCTVGCYFAAFQDGGNIGVLCSANDITCKIEAEQRKFDFINFVSHEIRTPLTVIMAMSQLLLSERELDLDRVRKYFRTIYRESQKITELVNNFLDIQIIESGKHFFYKEKTSIMRIIHDVLSLYEMNPKHRFILETDKDEYPALYIDPVRINQVLTNLISNAIKYSPNGGYIKVKVQERDKSILISVEDQGLGIPEEAIPNLFSKFYRINNFTHKRMAGTGLGLAICKEIIKNHKGEIGVKSKLGVGSEFFFSLPLPTD